MQHYDPPQRKYRIERGIPPPWWPLEKESWWNEMKFIKDLRLPLYRKSCDLNKSLEVCILTYVTNNPNFLNVRRHVFDNNLQNIKFSNLSTNHMTLCKVVGRDLR